jgi:hypothetical protein
MKSSLRVLSGVLLAATIGMGALGGPNEAVAAGSKAGEGKEQKWPIILVGANGHDTVGGLMPLPLWPPAAVAQGTVPAKSSRKRRSQFCCNIMRQSGAVR